MKKIHILLVCFLLGLSGCSSSFKENSKNEVGLERKQSPPADFIPRNVQIVALGDSLTQGVGNEHEEGEGGYLPFLREELESMKSINQVKFKNFGKKGNRTDQLLKRMKKQEIETSIEDADMVIITIGGNDIMQVFKENMLGLKLKKFITAESGYRDRLNEILSLVRQYNPEAAIVLVGIYNPFMKWFSDIEEMDEIVRNWNEASEEISQQHTKTLFVPVADLFINKEEKLLYKDYFHPNEEGYKLMADRIHFYMTTKALYKDANIKL